MARPPPCLCPPTPTTSFASSTQAATSLYTASGRGRCGAQHLINQIWGTTHESHQHHLGEIVLQEDATPWVVCSQEDELASSLEGASACEQLVLASASAVAVAAAAAGVGMQRAPEAPMQHVFRLVMVGAHQEVQRLTLCGNINAAMRSHSA